MAAGVRTEAVEPREGRGWCTLTYTFVASRWPLGGVDRGRRRGRWLGKAGDGHATGHVGPSRGDERRAGMEYSPEEGVWMWGLEERSGEGVATLSGLS